MTDRIQDYLQQLAPQARASLLTELERLEVCGEKIPEAAAILEQLRAEFRKTGQTTRRVANPSRFFFKPLEPLLVDGAPEHGNTGRILRGSLAAIWEWISHDLLPAMANDYIKSMVPLIAADDQREARKVVTAFQTKVIKYLENTFGSPEGADRARKKLASYTISRAAYGDLVKTLCVLRARDALAKLADALPAKIENLNDARVSHIWGLLAAFGKNHPDALTFAVTLVAKRLATPWQLILLATKASPGKNAADIAVAPYASAIAMVLDQLEDKQTALRLALRNERVAFAKEILIEIYDIEDALRTHIRQLDESEWGKRLKRLMGVTAALVQAEVSRFPDEVHHVLASPGLRRHQAQTGRLTSLVGMGRDVLTGGASFCRKLIGPSQ